MRVGGELGVVKKMKSEVVFFGKEDGIISGANGSERPDVEVGFVKVGGPWGLAGFHPRELLNSSPQGHLQAELGACMECVFGSGGFRVRGSMADARTKCSQLQIPQERTPLLSGA